jgi:hypothetical protein
VSAAVTDRQPARSAPAEQLTVPAPPPAQLSEAARFRLAAGGLVAGLLAVWWVIAQPGFFHSDDLVFLGISESEGRFSAEWLFDRGDLHWAPGHHLVYSLAGEATVGAWQLVLLFEVLVFGAGLLAFLGSLNALLGRSWWHLLPTAFVGGCLAWSEQMAWPGPGLQTLPEFASGTACLYGFLRWQRTRRRAFLVLSVGALALGVLFYARAVLIVVVVLLVRVLLLERELSVRRVRAILREDRAAWLSLGAVALAFVVHEATRDALGDQPPYTAAQLAEYVGRLLFENLAPMALGIRLEAGGERTVPETVAQAGGVALAAAALAWSLRHRRAAWRAWAIGAVAIALTVALMARTRLGFLGPEIGLVLRYVTHLAWILPLVVVAALARRRPGDPLPADLPPVPPRAFGLAAGVVAVVVVASLATSRQEVRAHGGVQTRAWVAELRETSAPLARAGAFRPRVADGPVPEAVVPAFLGGWTQYSFVLPVLDAPVDATSEMLPSAVVRPDGSVVPALFSRSELTGPAGAGVRRTGPWRREAGAWCAAPARGVSATLEVRPREPVLPGGAVVRFPGVRGLERGPLPVTLDIGEGLRPDRLRRLAVPFFPQDPVVATTHQRLRSLEVRVPGGRRVCFDRIEVGRMDAGGARGG